MNDTATFQFKPRQEAHPMKWDELMTPVRKSLADLLIRIEGAERAVNGGIENNTNRKKEVANCFLVYGIRGTGKTTVLLSAQHALCDSNFIPPKEEKNTKEETLEEKTLRESIQYLKEQHIVWLPILDLEPLPVGSNILTTILTHVLNAIESSDCGKKAQLTSIFEESADSPRQKFKELIRDATTIWEDIQEVATREKVSRQVAVADMYARVHKQFQDTITALSEQLAKEYGRDTKGCSMVLSIDNVDRNTDQLNALAKFAQLLSHNRLWLIMAGEEKDIEAFLERGYWKELNYRKKDNLDLSCRKNWEGEDETLVVARRQAAAVYQKLLPPSHRVEIDRVKPKETLRFKPPTEDENIYQLLHQIKIFLCDSENEKDKDKKFYFTELLGISPSEEESSKKPQENPVEDPLSHLKMSHKTNHEYFFYVEEINSPPQDTEKELKKPIVFAWHALHLPARTVLDLWQLAHYVVGDHINAKGKKFQAERIARKMLRNAVYRSHISDTLGKCLQNDIIRRLPDGGTLLKLDGYKTRAGYLLKQDLEKTPKLQRLQDLVGRASRSTIYVYKAEDINICLEQQNAINNKKNAENFKTPQLPDIVAAWLAILHDILMMVEWPAIISPINIESRFIMTSHKLATHKVWNKGESKEFWWPAPLWSTFYANDVFSKQWSNLYEKLRKFNFLDVDEIDEKHDYDKDFVDLNTRLLVTSWIQSVLKAFALLNPSFIENSKSTEDNSNLKSNNEDKQQTDEPQDRENKIESILQVKIEKNLKDLSEVFQSIMLLPIFSLEELKKPPDTKENSDSSKPKEIAIGKLEMLEEQVIQVAHDLYKAIIHNKEINCSGKKPVLIENDQMQEWLEKKLPLLFSYLYVPLGKTEEDAIQRCYDMFSKGPESELNRYWKNNALFFLADLDEELNKIFPRKKILKDLEPDEKPSNDEPYEVYIKSLGSFGAFHRFWTKPKPKDIRGNPHASL